MTAKKLAERIAAAAKKFPRLAFITMQKPAGDLQRLDGTWGGNIKEASWCLREDDRDGAFILVGEYQLVRVLRVERIQQITQICSQAPDQKGDGKT